MRVRMLNLTRATRTKQIQQARTRCHSSFEALQPSDHLGMEGLAAQQLHENALLSCMTSQSKCGVRLLNRSLTRYLTRPQTTRA